MTPTPTDLTPEAVQAMATALRPDATGWRYGQFTQLDTASDMLHAFAARLAQEAGTCETCRHALPPFPDTGDRVCVKIYSRYGHAVVPLKGDDGRPFGCRGWKAKETT